jgi:hypothetical protein
MSGHLTSQLKRWKIGVVRKPKHALRALRLRCAEPQELMKKSATSDSCLANTSRSPVNSKILEVFRIQQEHDYAMEKI